MCLEIALAYLNISHKEWVEFYTDLKCLNSTVKVDDRTKIKVTIKSFEFFFFQIVKTKIKLHSLNLYEKI